MSDIKAIFFDFGGVIARLDREQVRALEERYGLPRGGLLEALYGIPEWQEAERGLLPEEKWLQAVLRRLEEMAGRPIPDIQKDWHIVWRQLDQEVLELARRLRQRYVVGIISNSTPRLEREVLQPQGIDGLFHHIVNSSRVGMAKPDPRIFRLAAAWAGLPPHACVHIDDLPQNVQGAREAGFHAILHRGDLPTTILALRGLGVEV
ncbi:MAG: HAD family phosphatase [Dehalococcoidia bacterium]|jgi:putative hydrolase of the HAD superfamily|nr:HAD family phosphatase [Dehalococcoidia bacterium]